MKKPKMILFDFGHTLCYEKGFDGVRGTQAIMRHAVKNKRNLDAAEISAFADTLFEGIAANARSLDLEVHHLINAKFMYEYLQIEFNLPPAQIERIFWDNASPGTAMPHVDKALAYLKHHDIRSGVISNISFSGDTLTDRINRLLPDNNFEFIIASSEYLFRKPNKMIFELALRKAELSADDVWYCGNEIILDVAASAYAGIYPVWYFNETECRYKGKHQDIRSACDYLHIRDWLELIDVLEGLPA